jgi:mannose-6-phosphate isomerase-like protein (cupin superfamily)
LFVLSFYKVVGMGISLLIATQLRKHRLPERLRIAFLSWLEEDESDENAETKKLRKPTKVIEVAGTSLGSSSGGSSTEGEDDTGVRRVLLSPNSALTSTLHVVLLTIPAGTEIVPQTAGGVEFYYVIQGDGVYSHGENNAIVFTKGDGFVVDPGW